MRPSERAVEYVTVSPSKGGMSFDPVSSSERGVVSITVSPSKGGADFYPVSQSDVKMMWPFILSVTVKKLWLL